MLSWRTCAVALRMRGDISLSVVGTLPMQPFSVPTICLVAGTLMLASVRPADAQVTLNLTTTQQTNCVATTDAQGLRLVPGGTDLAATGVTLSGTGCGGSQTSDFQAAIQVPPSPTAGTPFNVQWSAGSAATQCTYGGSSGITGWPVGGSACQGTACNGAHTTSVTVPNAGSFALNVTCTNASGFAQGTGTAASAPQAPQPPNFALTAPSSATVNTAFSVGWTVSGATTCTGSASLNGNSVSLSGWTDANLTSPMPPRSVTATQAGTYTLKLTCSNANGQTQSAPATVAVGAVGDTCPAGRQTQATVCYNYNMANSACSANTDVTSFNNIWGRLSPSDSPIAFPGNQFFAIFKDFNKTQYIAAKITVPASGMDPTSFGIITHGETLAGPNLTMSISDKCGDFSPTAPICLTTNTQGGQIGAKWKLSTATQVNGCPLVPGQSYYLNIKATNPTQTNVDCPANSQLCRLTVQSNHTP